MEGKKDLLLKSAMFYGLLLGAFWIVKYMFFIIGTFYPILDSVSVILAPLTVVLAYLFTKVYKVILGGRIGFGQAWKFGVLLFFFASLLESLPQYVFYRYIATPEYMSALVEQASALVDSMKLGAQMKSEITSQLASMTPIRLTFQGIATNVIYGILFSIPIAAILCRTIIPADYLKSSD
ncbi:MAG: DUF4199 domain-containing protein [Tannerellaceae bacterium]|jgi:hypothetical protein|nr:DUF4199 domain-containing protein [Tannerellaceae bacterium]